MNRNYIGMYADGGMPADPSMDPAMAEGGAPAPEQGGGGAEQLQAMVGEYAQSRDPQLAVAIADTLVELMGAGAPAAPAGPEGGLPPEGAPMGANGMALPVFRRGGAIKVSGNNNRPKTALEKFRNR